MRKLSIVFVIAAVAAAAPAHAQNREHLQMAAELRILQQQNQELANTLAQMIQLMNETAKALNSRIDQTNEAIRKGFADQSLTLNTTAGDVRKTLAQTQDAATRLGELKEEVAALRTSIPAMLSRLTVAPPVSIDVDPSAISASGDPAVSPALTQPPVSTAGLDPGRMYATAFGDYGGGNFALAVQGFQEFLKAFPTSARAHLAQQYIGDAEFNQGRFAEAIVAYNLVIQNYPKSDQVPWAYYKRGMSQLRLGQTAAARTSFETVVKLFPDSEPAIQSLSRLQGIDAAPAAPTTKGK